MGAWLGWDVGAWHCQGGAARDALVLVGAEPGGAVRLLGRPWRGNLRATLNGARGLALLDALLALVDAEGLRPRQLTVGIDTPLAWPDAFRALLDGVMPGAIPSTKAENPLVMRFTERFLCARGLRPLSPVQDLIVNPILRSPRSDPCTTLWLLRTQHKKLPTTALTWLYSM